MCNVLLVYFKIFLFINVNFWGFYRNCYRLIYINWVVFSSVIFCMFTFTTFFLIRYIFSCNPCVPWVTFLDYTLYPIHIYLYFLFYRVILMDLSTLKGFWFLSLIGCLCFFETLGVCLFYVDHTVQFRGYFSVLDSSSVIFILMWQVSSLLF